MKPLMPLVAIWQDFLLTSSYCPDPVQGHIRHRVLCQHRDVTPPHCWAQEQHTSPSSPGAPFWLHPDALQAGGRSWSLPCLLLVTEQRCCWSVSAVAMGIGRQVLGAGVSNSVETASLHSYCKLQETSKKTTYRAPLPCFVFDTTGFICSWSLCSLPGHYRTLQCTGYLLLTRCCFSVSPRA